jgi:hypothetical protein
MELGAILLTSNINYVKHKEMDAKSKEITIIAFQEDIESGNKDPILYAYRYGMTYDPHDEFKPRNVSGQKLSPFHVDQYFKQLDSARKEYKRHFDAWHKDMSDPIQLLERRIAEKEKELAEAHAALIQLKMVLNY